MNRLLFNLLIPPALCLAILMGGAISLRPRVVLAQADDVPAAAAEKSDKDLRPMPPGKEPSPNPPATKVEVTPLSSDGQIARRLQRILVATNWYNEPSVEAEEGVVFLKGKTETEERRKWAGDLARNTQDVVAVVNHLQVTQPALLDFQPAIAGMRELWRSALQRSPWVLFGLLVFFVAYWAARSTRKVLLYLFRDRFASGLLQNVAAWCGGALVFLLGLYVVLYVSGLTRLALTVVGGTGLFGLVLGIGFRDITENFLASILLSVQTPFRTGDVVEIIGVSGIVQRMTIRATLLMTFEGNHVQIPNSLVYKSTIRNLTSNPNVRLTFTLGVGHEVRIAEAQEIAMRVLREHVAVLQDPEPMVLADSVETSSVMLRLYFWINGREHSGDKVRSAIIRLVLQAFNDAHIAMPDANREVFLSREVPVRLLDGEQRHPPAPEPKLRQAEVKTRSKQSASEGNLSSETAELQHQAEISRPPEGGEDLLNKGEESAAKVEANSKVEVG